MLTPGASLVELLALPEPTAHEEAENEVLQVLKKLKAALKRLAKLEPPL
jgi:hypothetical protein